MLTIRHFTALFKLYYTPLNMLKVNRYRNMIDGDLNQTSGHLRFPAAAIESEHELVNVFLQVSIGHPMVGTQ